MTQLRTLEEPLARELLAAPLVASLATLNPDGSIHVIPVWFVWDGEALLVATSAASRKARNVEVDGRATLMLHDSPGGVDVRGVTIYGRAEVLRGTQAITIGERIHLKYVTASGLAIPSVAEFLGGDDVVLRIVPERVAVFDESASTAARELRESGEFVATRGIR
jgi:PPOX class probable F420-dependent enzyme